MRRRAASLRGASRRRTRGDAMRARRGANFATNAVPFFAFMVGGSYGISVLLQVRSEGVDESFSCVIRMPTRALTTPYTTETPT